MRGKEMAFAACAALTACGDGGTSEVRNPACDIEPRFERMRAGEVALVPTRLDVPAATPVDVQRIIDAIINQPERFDTTEDLQRYVGPRSNGDIRVSGRTVSFSDGCYTYFVSTNVNADPATEPGTNRHLSFRVEPLANYGRDMSVLVMDFKQEKRYTNSGETVVHENGWGSVDMGDAMHETSIGVHRGAHDYVRGMERDGYDGAPYENEWVVWYNSAVAETLAHLNRPSEE